MEEKDEEKRRKAQSVHDRLEDVQIILHLIS